MFEKGEVPPAKASKKVIIYDAGPAQKF